MGVDGAASPEVHRQIISTLRRKYSHAIEQRDANHPPMTPDLGIMLRSDFVSYETNSPHCLVCSVCLFGQELSSDASHVSGRTWAVCSLSVKGPICFSRPSSDHDKPKPMYQIVPPGFRSARPEIHRFRATNPRRVQLSIDEGAQPPLRHDPYGQ